MGRHVADLETRRRAHKTFRPTDAECDKPHYLYRIFGPDDVLLYIGVAEDVESRIYMHKAAGLFEIQQLYVRHTSERYPNKLAVRAAERAAIQSEAPMFNKQHNPKRWKRIDGHYQPVGDFMTTEDFRAMWRKACGEYDSSAYNALSAMYGT